MDYKRKKSPKIEFQKNGQKKDKKTLEISYKIWYNIIYRKEI